MKHHRKTGRYDYWGRKHIRTCFIVIFLHFIFFSFSISATAAPVSIETARQAAQNLVNAASTGRVALAERTLLSEAPRTWQSTTVYYVFRFQPAGWALISADDVAHPVIGYSRTAAWSGTEQPPALTAWLDAAAEAIHSAVSAGTAQPPETAESWTRIVSGSTTRSTTSVTPASVAPLMDTITWGQGWPYNGMCPADASSSYNDRVPSGCVATAMAQIMLYHQHPATGWGSHTYTENNYGSQAAYFSSTSYGFASLAHDYDSTENAPGAATLIYHAAVSVEMDFSTTGSSASVTDAMDALKTYFKYHEGIYRMEKADYTDMKWKTMVKAELDVGRPLIYSGNNPTTGAGHAFICDGNEDFDYFHFNWGWDGFYNGYFYLDSLIPISPNYNYTADQDAVFDIRPAETPNLSLPYEEGFETGAPVNWLLNAPDQIIISSNDAFSGANSLLLNDEAGSDFYGTYTAMMKINVPEGGAMLSFGVKRQWNWIYGNTDELIQQKAYLRSEFGNEVLETFFDGDFNDYDWLTITSDLRPYAGETVALVFEVQNSVIDDHLGWMYVDDVKVEAFQTPVSNFSTDQAVFCSVDGQAATVQFLDHSKFFPNAWNWSFQKGTPSTSSNQNPTVTYDNTGWFAAILTTTNELGTGTTKTEKNAIAVYPLAGMCERASVHTETNNYGMGILHVEFNTIDHQSGETDDDGGYLNLAGSKITHLRPDQSYPITVTTGTTNSEYVKVYIDYNGDGDFSDTGEAVLSTSKSMGKHTGTVTTPISPNFNTILRMRIVSDFYSISDDCGDLQYGQAEDYGVIFDLPGDFNGDDAIGLQDLIPVLKILSGTTAAVDTLADPDTDGVVSMADAIFLLETISETRN